MLVEGALVDLYDVELLRLEVIYIQRGELNIYESGKDTVGLAVEPWMRGYEGLYMLVQDRHFCLLRGMQGIVQSM